MKTILVFSWFYLPFIGGAELFVKAVTDRLRGRFRFVIVTARADRALPPIEEDGDVTILRTGLGNRADKFLYPIAALSRALALDRVDLVHAIMVNASAVAAWAYTKLKPRPTLLTLQEGDTEAYARDYLGPFFPIYPRLHRPFDRIHAISRFLERQAVAYGADPAIIRVIPNGVDTDVFHPAASSAEKGTTDALRDQLGLDRNHGIVSVSRLVPKNGIDTLVEAMVPLLKARPDSKLVIVGDGPERKRLESRATELGVRQAVVFVGEVPHERTADYLRVADVFVRPSRSEGLGSAFLEAMASGVPVVATPVGGIPDFLENEVTGVFCEPENPESVARAVGRVLADGALSGRLENGGLRLVESHYLWDQVAEELSMLYEEML